MDITWMLTKEDFARVKHTVNRHGQSRQLWCDYSTILTPILDRFWDHNRPIIVLNFDRLDYTCVRATIIRPKIPSVLT